MSTLSHYPESVRIVRKRHIAISAKYGKGAAYAARRLSNEDRRQFAALLRRTRAEGAYTRLHVVQVTDGQVSCALQYLPTGSRPWVSVSFHESVAEAIQAFREIPSHMDREVAHYRVEESIAR